MDGAASLLLLPHHTAREGVLLVTEEEMEEEEHLEPISLVQGYATTVCPIDPPLIRPVV